MASTSNTEIERKLFFETIRLFPPVINGRINASQFVDAATDLVAIVERMGKSFAPVKYDMQGNIDKIKKYYKYDENSCLLEFVAEEIKKEKPPAAEGLLWLNRALLFFEIVFQEIITCLQANNYEIGMKRIFTLAYEGSVKRYHNWVSQQIFTFICKMSPTLPQILKALEADNSLKAFEARITAFNITLHLNRCKLDDFYKEKNIFQDDRLKY